MQNLGGHHVAGQHLQACGHRGRVEGGGVAGHDEDDPVAGASSSRPSATASWTRPVSYATSSISCGLTRYPVS